MPIADEKQASNQADIEALQLRLKPLELQLADRLNTSVEAARWDLQAYTTLCERIWALQYGACPKHAAARAEWDEFVPFVRSTKPASCIELARGDARVVIGMAARVSQASLG